MFAPVPANTARRQMRPAHHLPQPDRQRAALRPSEQWASGRQRHAVNGRHADEPDGSSRPSTRPSS
eukprot:3229424-Prymnesium_polylepis.1